LAKIDRLPKSEAMIVMNVRRNGAAPCVTIKLLIHIVHVVFRNRSGDTTWRQLKKNIAIKQRK
jgi:hypothetical protein